MATLTPGNRLWFYQLLSERIGTGKQVPLATVEEVIAAEGVEMEDVGCADVRELMEALTPFAKLTVFKKGRTYVTVVPQPEWDGVLARAKEAKPAQPTAGAKSWKHKKSSKDPVPARPKPLRKRARKVEDRASGGAAAAAETSKAAATGTAQVATTTEAGDAAEAKAAPVVATEATGGTDAGRAAKGAATPVEAPAGTPAATPAQVQGADGETSAVEAAEEAQPATQPHPKIQAVEAPASEVSPAATASPAPAPVAGAVPETQPAAAPAKSDTSQAPAAKAQESAPEAAPQPSIHFTITYDPYEGMDDALAEAAGDEPKPAVAPADAPKPDAQATRPPAPTPAREPKPQRLEPAVPAVATRPKPVSPLTLQADLPQSLSAEAHMKDEVLRLLWDVLPMGSDVAAVLDEDWRVARSTGTLAGTRSRVTFPLRYLREDGASHVEVTLRRTARPVAGKRWSVAFVDGSGSVAEGRGSGLEGLAAEREGAWQLLGGRDRTTSASPQRELEQFAVVGPWDSLLERLAAVAAPEDWGEGRSVMRELLCVTFHRVMCEGKLATLADGSAAAFNTGLVTSVRQDVCALLAPHQGDIPWELVGFYPADAPELAVFGDTPQPASFVSTLADVALPTGANVRLSPAVERELGDDAAWYLAHALQHARVSYRVLAPAYDPEAEALCLLLPLRVNTAAHADRALALSPDGRGGWTGIALLSLDEAYACARPVCAEQPSWLAR